MKILLVNKFHYLKGGSEKYYFELADLLKQNGHEVAFFSMKDENNITTGEKEYFVEKTDMNTASKLKAFDVIYSKANKELMTKALEEFEPDVVHINNFQRQLSASIIKAIKEKNIPIVMTAHDLNSICPASAMLYKNQICDDCLKKGYISCIKKSCIKNSKLKSVVGVMEYEYYKAHHVWKKIDTIITPSNFIKNKLISGNNECENIVTIHNFVNETNTDDVNNGDYALFVGRLSVEKGILNLVKAVGLVPKAKLYIAGDGPEKDSIEQYIAENKLENKIKLLGYLNQNEIKEYIKNAKCVVLPSICQENCPYSVLEAMEIGKPVIGSRIGGIPELVEDGKSGFLYQYDSVEDLAQKITALFDDDSLVDEFSKRARELFCQNYSAQVYYTKLMEIYKKLIKG